MDLNYSQAFLAIIVPLRESLMHSLRRLLGKEVTVTDRPLKTKKENCYNKIDAVEENTRTASLHKHEERTKDKEKIGTVPCHSPTRLTPVGTRKPSPNFNGTAKQIHSRNHEFCSTMASWCRLRSCYLFLTS